MIFLLLIFVQPAAFAAPVFSGSGSYSVKPEWQEAAPAVNALSEARYESSMNYTSFEPGSEKPSFTNETTERVRWKKLPPEKGEDKFELLYEDYRTRSKVQILPGMAPIDNAQDFGVYLSSKPLKLSGSGGQPTRIDNLAAIRSQLGAEVKDNGARQALLVTFQESILLDGARAFLQENSCLRDLGRKTVGAKWQMQFETQGMKVGYECKLEGWAEAGGQRVLVLGITIPRITQETKQLMGSHTTNVQTEGSGKLYFEPKTRESLAELDMNISQLASGSDPKAPRSLSRLKSTAHALPL